MTDALIVFAHGARDPRWREPVDAIAQRLGPLTSGAHVGVAFLELMSPTLLEAIAAARASGARSIAVAPLFWSRGAHLREDLPRMLDEVRQQWPELTVTVWPVLGESPRVLEAISQAYAALWHQDTTAPPAGTDQA